MQIPAMIAAFRTSVDNNLTTTPAVDTIDIHRRERERSSSQLPEVCADLRNSPGILYILGTSSLSAAAAQTSTRSPSSVLAV